MKSKGVKGEEEAARDAAPVSDYADVDTRGRGCNVSVAVSIESSGGAGDAISATLVSSTRFGSCPTQQLHDCCVRASSH